MARERGPDAADRPALGRTAAAATNVVLAPVWLVFWLQRHLQSLRGDEQPDWFRRSRPIETEPGISDDAPPLEIALPDEPEKKTVPLATTEQTAEPPSVERFHRYFKG